MKTFSNLMKFKILFIAITTMANFASAGVRLKKEVDIEDGAQVVYQHAKIYCKAKGLRENQKEKDSVKVNLWITQEADGTFSYDYAFFQKELSSFHNSQFWAGEASQVPANSQLVNSLTCDVTPQKSGLKTSFIRCRLAYGPDKELQSQRAYVIFYEVSKNNLTGTLGVTSVEMDATGSQVTGATMKYSCKQSDNTPIVVH